MQQTQPLDLAMIKCVSATDMITPAPLPHRTSAADGPVGDERVLIEPLLLVPACETHGWAATCERQVSGNRRGAVDGTAPAVREGLCCPSAPRPVEQSRPRIMRANQELMCVEVNFGDIIP
ncbi:hypothetical protein [Streptomyces sp. NPDC051554]|uniref:hypothetical protein n=1 Tax=Streptomyces sp. NPDC051554 TaxID=3365656 RepID=UPI00379C68E8